jgi:hypothetical protein
VLSSQFIQRVYDFGNLHLLAVYGSGNSLFKSHGDILAFLWSLLRRGAKYQKVPIIGFVGGILQLQPFMADVPDIAVTAVGGICGKRQMDAVCLTVFDLGFSGIHCPLIISPCRYNLQVRRQRLDPKLKTNLVVSLAGSAVADG